VKLFLVGGLGFIGKRFIRKYAKDYEIIVFAKKNTIEKVDKNGSFKNIILEEGSMDEKTIIDVITKHKPDVVIHLAALTGLKKCHSDPEKAFKINVFGTFNVLSACNKTGSKLIFLSSREVYGDTKKQETSEDDELNPNNVYGLTKLIGENLVLHFKKLYNLEYTILRITNVYGPEGDNYGAQRIIMDAIKNNKIKILGGKQHLNFIYVDDIVDLLGTLVNGKISNQIFNVGSADTMSIDEFAEKISRLMQKSILMEHYSMRETETSFFKPNLTKIKKLIGFEANTQINTGLQKTIEWYSK